MKTTILKTFIISLISFSFSGILNSETGWEYQQSTFQAFYMLEDTQIDGIAVESTDVIGAFKNGICVGWVYADPGGFTTIPLMGDDGSEYSNGYMLNEEIADLVDKHIADEEERYLEMEKQLQWYQKELNLNPLSWGKRKNK